MTKIDQIVYTEIKSPKLDCSNTPIQLTDDTISERYAKVIARMQEENYDVLVIYADLEHGSNFEYLTGFLPRFEEALLVIHKDGNNYMIMGNENLNKVQHARIKAVAIHAPHFSLPNQPMETKLSFEEILKQASITKNMNVGLVGWKNFTSKFEDNAKLFDMPAYIVDTIKSIVGNDGNISNATYLFIGNKGARCTNNVNEIEHYEFGASLASDCMLKAMDYLNEGVTEMEIGQILNAYGQKNSVVTIAASGPRFVKANIYPTNNTVKLGDTISLTVGYKGGLSSRSGYAVNDESELPDDVKDYLEKVVKPYYNSTVNWLEKIHCGMTGNEIYELMEEVLPKDQYNWGLCPGHLCADEEWLSSPIYKGSKEILESGMILQLDIIPSVKGYGGTSAESTLVLANDELKAKIAKEAPEMWKRILDRKEYIKNTLKIKLNDDVLPLASTLGYLRPFLLEKNKAMAVKQ